MRVNNKYIHVRIVPYLADTENVKVPTCLVCLQVLVL